MHAATTRADRAVEAAPALDLEARMAVVGVEMTARLDRAAMTVAVNTAHIGGDLDLGDVVRGPVEAPLPPLVPYPSPVAALLQRAERRLETYGWCRGMVVDEDGATCLYGAIHAEADTPGMESDAMDVLLEVIRRQYPGADRVESWSDSCTEAQLPIRMMWRGADLANARSI